MRMRVWSLASLSGLRIWYICELWCRLEAIALIWPLAWGPPYAAGVALKRKKSGPLPFSYWCFIWHHSTDDDSDSETVSFDVLHNTKNKQQQQQQQKTKNYSIITRSSYFLFLSPAWSQFYEHALDILGEKRKKKCGLDESIVRTAYF